jgi:hypothetical protein
MPKSHARDRDRFIPCTPGGTMLFHLARATKEAAIKALMENASHMPYGTWENFEQRGYEILDMEKHK